MSGARATRDDSAPRVGWSLSSPICGVAARLRSGAASGMSSGGYFGGVRQASPGRESRDGQGQQQPEERQEEQEAEAGQDEGRAEEVTAVFSMTFSGTSRPASRHGAPAVAVWWPRRVERVPALPQPGSVTGIQSEEAVVLPFSARTAKRSVDPGAIGRRMSGSNPPAGVARRMPERAAASWHRRVSPRAWERIRAGGSSAVASLASSCGRATWIGV